MNAPVRFFGSTLILWVTFNAFTSCSFKEVFSDRPYATVNYSLEEAVTLSQVTEQLRYHGFLKDSIRRPAFDVFLNDKTDNLGKNPTILLTLQCLRAARSGDRGAMQAAVREGRFEELLSPELQKIHQTQLKQIGQSGSPVVLGLQSNVLFLLNTMQTQLDHLLDVDTLTTEKLLESYWQAREEESLQSILLPLLKEPVNNALTASILSDADLRKARETVLEMEAIGTFQFNGFMKNRADSLRYIETYYENLGEYFNLKRDVNKICRESLRSLQAYAINYASTHVGIPETRAFDDLLDRKRYEISDIETGDTDYVDMSVSADSSVRIRFRFRTGTFRRLKIDHEIKRTTAEVFVWYTVGQGGSHAFTTEVPLGLTLDAVDIGLSSGANGGRRFVSPESGLVVNLQLPRIGIWGRYEYNAEKLKLASRLLGCPVLQGVELQGITFSRDTWEPKFQFAWHPTGILSDLAQSDRDFSSLVITSQDLKSFTAKTFKDTLQARLIKAVCAKIEAAAVESKTLRELFHCKSIRGLKIHPVAAADNEFLSGKIQLAGVEIPLFDHTIDTLTLRVNYFYQSGEARFRVDQINLQRFAPDLRRLITSNTSDLFELAEGQLPDEKLEHLKELVQEYFVIQSIFFDFDKHALMVKFSGKLHAINSTKALYQVMRDRLADVRQALLTNALSHVREEITTQANAACQDLVNSAVNFFGLPFTVDHVDGCSGNATFSASLDEIKITGEIQGDKLRVTHFDADPLLERVRAELPDKIGFQDYLYIDDSRIVSNTIVLSVTAKFLPLNFEEKILDIRINADGQSDFSFVSLRAKIGEKLTQFIHQNEDALPMGEFAGMTLGFASIDLERYLIFFDASAEFDYGIVVKSQLSLNLKTGAVGCSILNDPTNAIVSALSSGLLSGLLGDGSPVTVDPLTIDNIKRMQITGSVNIMILGTVPLPSMRFTLSRSGLDMELRPKFTLPFVVPIAPPIASLVNPTAELQLDAKVIQFRGSFAPGANEDCRFFMHLIQVKAFVNIYYGVNAGDVDFNGDLVLIDFIPIARGNGRISIGDKIAFIEQGTSGILDKVIHLKSRTELGKTATSFFAKSGGELNILSIIDAQLALVITVNSGQYTTLHIDGTGQVEIPIGKLSGNIGTKLGTDVKEMMNNAAYASLKGGLKVGSFDLAGIIAKANLHHALLQFYVGPLKLGAQLPTLSGFTSDYVIRMILAIIGSVKNLPDALLHFFEHPNITLGTPFGSGDSEFAGIDNNNSSGVGRMSDAGVESEGGVSGGNTQANGGQVAGANGQSQGGSPQLTGGGQQQKPRTEVSGVPVAEVPYLCNCGNSPVGFHLQRFADLPKDKTYLAVYRSMFGVGLPFNRYGAELQQCAPGLFDNMVGFVFSNNSSSDVWGNIPLTTSYQVIGSELNWNYQNRMLQPGEHVAVGFIRQNAELDRLLAQDFHFLPFIPPNWIMGGGSLYDMTLSPARATTDQQGTTFHLANRDVTMLSTDNSKPVYMFVLAYKEGEAHILTSTYTNSMNSYSSPFCGASTRTYESLYRNGDEFVISDATFRGRVIHSYTVKGLFNRFHEVSDHDADLEHLLLAEPSDLYMVKRQLKRNDDFRAYVVENQVDGKLYLTVVPLTASVPGNNQGESTIAAFRTYVDKTSQLVAQADVNIVLALLNGCGAQQGTIDQFRDRGISNAASFRLIKYFNALINNVPISLEDLCMSAYLEEEKTTVVTALEDLGEGNWKLVFINIADNSGFGTAMRLPIEKCDLLQDLGISKSTVFNNDFFERNKMFRRVYWYMLLSNPEDRMDLALLDVSPEVLSWLKRSSTDPTAFSLVSMTQDSAALIDRVPQLYLKIKDLDGSTGDFLNKSNILTSVSLLNSVVPELLKNESSQAVVDRLNPDDPRSPLIGFHESKTVVRLFYDGSWKEISKEQFDKNLEASLSVLPGSDQARIQDLTIKDDAVRKATFLFDGLRGLSKWMKTSGTLVNPYALFNKAGLGNASQQQ